MMQIDRTKNTKRNALWGFVEKIIQMLLPFCTRTLILRLIGEKYLGLNGLFTSIISVLNMADLGFGAAIVYSMYKPIADNDTDALCALLNFYKKVYRIIGFVVLAIGMAIMPFLRYLIAGDVPQDINIYVLFAIYLCNVVASYWFFAYKKSLLSAYHRNDVATKISTGLLIGQYGLQILFLLLFNNYYVYILVLPVITLAGNILTSVVSKKLFPDIICRGVMEAGAKRAINKQVKGAFLGKLCGTTRNSLDSMFISSSLGLTQVAMYDSYYYILRSVHNLLNVATTSMIGGVGNSIAKESKEKNYKDFLKFTFLYSWISAWCACCMLCLYQPFMRLWIGENLMLPFHTMVLFCIYLYIISATDIQNVYYTARGLWWEGRWRSILEVCVNLLLNIIGVKFFGIWGVLMATIITMLLINFWYNARILFKNYFVGISLKKYFFKQLFYLLVAVCVSAFTYFLCSVIPTQGVADIIVRLGVCAIVPNILFYLIYFKTNDFKESKYIFGALFSKVLKKKSK